MKIIATVKNHKTIVFLSVKAGMQRRGIVWGLGGGVRVGGAAALYYDHKSLHDRHLFQSILTGVFRERLLGKEKNNPISSSSLRGNIPL